jgi:hypothetical protein
MFDYNEWAKQNRDEYGYLPRILCNDGFNFSVQSTFGSYSSPRILDRNDDPNKYEFDSAEVGYPNRDEKMLEEYIDGSNSFCENIYAYVPIGIINQIVNKHGGISHIEG